MRTTQAERGRVDGRQRAAAEIKILLADLYRSFVMWSSLYGDADGPYEQEQRERVASLMDRLQNGYLARSMWLEPGVRRRVEGFVEKSEDLYSKFCTDIEGRGYARARKRTARHVSGQLRSLRKNLEAELADDPDDPRRFPWPMRPRRSR